MRSKTMTLFLEMLVRRQRRNYTTRKRKLYWNVLSLGAISNRWQEITGQPDSSSWLDKLGKHAVRKKWRTPFIQIINLPLEDVACLQKSGGIEDVFMFVNNPEEKRAVAQFLARKGADQDLLQTFFSPDVLANLPLDQNEQPEPARERGDRDGDQPPRPLVPDLNEIPPLVPDLNEVPPQEQDQAGDGGGE